MMYVNKILVGEFSMKSFMFIEKDVRVWESVHL